MKRSGIPKLIGKRIESVVVATGDGDRDSTIGTQIFLVFDDRTYFEIYGKPYLTSGVMPGGRDDAVKYARDCSATSVEVFESS